MLGAGFALGIIWGAAGGAAWIVLCRLMVRWRPGLMHDWMTYLLIVPACAAGPFAWLVVREELRERPR